MKKILFLTIVLLMSFSAFCQQKNADDIIKKLQNKMNLVKDYQADITINVDVDFIKIPQKKAKMYFKQPDKVKFDATGFILVPKKGVSLSIDNFLGKNYTAIYVKNAKLGVIETDVIKIIPNDENSEMVLTTLWVDVNKTMPLKMETSAKKGSTITIEFFYESKNEFDLPSKMIISFNTDDTQSVLPFQDDDNKKKKDTKSKKGTVTVTYANYLINKGISDDIFIDKDTKNKK